MPTLYGVKMIIYRVKVRTSETGGMFMDGTSSLALAISEVEQLQAENPQYKISVEAEEWRTLISLKYRWYQLTGGAEGFGVDFQNKSGHKHAGVTPVWPEL